MGELKKLNLGCGKDIKKGFLNLDIARREGVDVVADISKRLPFPKERFDVIYCSNVIEHIKEIDPLFIELYRILSPQGKVIIKVPYFSQIGAISIDHHHSFSLKAVDYFDWAKRKCGNDNRDMPYKFRIIKKELLFLPQFKRGITKIFLWAVYVIPYLVYKISPLAYEWFFPYLFPASEVYFELEKID